MEALKSTKTSNETAVYGSDINDEDIAVMTETDSPWKATAGVNARSMGASLIRMVALAAAGELASNKPMVPSFLFTREFLLENAITSMEDLNSAMPKILLPDFMTACWIETASDVQSASNVTEDAVDQPQEAQPEVESPAQSPDAASCAYAVQTLVAGLLMTMPAFALLM